MTNINNSNIYENFSDKKLIFIFSIPSIISLLLESLTSIIDTAFAGHIIGLNSEALEAMGILYPVLTILIATQLLFGVSNSIFISRYLGMGDNDGVNKTFFIGFFANLIFACSISLLLFIFMKPIISFLGAEGIVYNLSLKYMRIALISNIFSSVGYNLVNNLRAFGYPKLEVYIASFSIFINVIFNYYFTFTLNLGISGIALATLISELFYTLAGVYFLYKYKLWFKFKSLDISFIKKIILSMFKIGIVQFGVQLINSLSALVINYRLISLGSSIFVGAFSIVQKIEVAALMPIIGITQGLMSILSYFKGNNNKERMKSIIKKCITYSLLYGITVTLITFIFNNKIVRIFTNNNEIINISSTSLRIVFNSFFILGFIYTFISYLQVTDREKTALFIGVFRQFLILLPLVYILPQIFNNNPNFVFISISLSNLLTLIAIFFIYKKGC